MQWKARIALGLVIVLVAMTGASSAQGATTNPSITIQDATLISPLEILVTGTSNCQSVFDVTAGLQEDNGAHGNGGNPFSSGTSGNWSVTVNDASAGTTFVKGKADITVEALCGTSPVTNTPVTNTRTIPVN